MAKKNDTIFFENKLLDFVTAKDPMFEMLQPFPLCQDRCLSVRGNLYRLIPYFSVRICNILCISWREFFRREAVSGSCSSRVLNERLPSA